MQSIFVNLPVINLARSRQFYEGLGYTINEKFSDDSAACVVISDTIYVIIMSKDRFATFAPNPVPDSNSSTGALFALALDNREAVDEMVNKVIKSGGRDNGIPQDYGFMFSRSISDPDGHVFEFFWMDENQFDAAQAEAEANK